MRRFLRVGLLVSCLLGMFCCDLVFADAGGSVVQGAAAYAYVLV